MHRILGPGYLEVVYEQALAIELKRRRIGFERQAAVEVVYRGQRVGQGRVDFIVERSLLVELKAVREFAPVHRAQVVSYLKATGLSLGLLINFNVRVLGSAGIMRVAYG